MLVSIHQPSYFPWLGLLQKIKESESFVLLDTVQFSDSLYQHRNKFLDNQGKETLLTIPVSKKGYTDKAIKDIVINNNIWQKKHQKFLYFNYKKHPYFDEIFPLVEHIFLNDYALLSDVLIDTLVVSLDIFAIDTPIVRASHLDLNKSLVKEDMVLDILTSVGATTYLSGEGARNYQNEENFISKEINITYQSFRHPIYEQITKTDSFIGGLSCLDAAFNLGKAACSSLLCKE